MCFLYNAGCVDKDVVYAVTVEDTKYITCMDCGADLEMTVFTGKFIGHLILDIGIFDELKFSEPIECPVCGEAREGVMFFCEPNNQSEIHAFFGLTNNN